MYLKLALAIVTAYRLQGQQSHNAPDLVITEHRQRTDELISMLPIYVQPRVTAYIQAIQNGAILNIRDILDTVYNSNSFH